MNQTLDKNNLGYLGIDFQYQLSRAMVEEPKFFMEIKSIVDQNAFTDNLLKRFVGTIKDYYAKWDNVPTYESIEKLLREKCRTTVDIDETTALIEKVRNTNLSGVEDTKDLAVKFFKQQAWVRLANEILKCAANGTDSYDEQAKKVEELTLVGDDDEYGYNIYDLMDKALSNDYTISIPTGIKMLDDTLGGGLDKGKLGLIIAPAGFGKTSFTTAIDSFAASYRCKENSNQGYKVLQIFFEDDPVDITRKHYSRLTQREARDFRRLREDEISTMRDWLNNYPDKELLKTNLRIVKMRTGVPSASDVMNYVKRLINTGFKPDLISIDYFECLAPEKGGRSTDSEWTREGATMRKLENMATELDCAIWVPTQGTKDSMNSPEVVRMDQASGSAKKVHVAQLIISIARSLEDIDNSKATLAILKNRAGKSGKVFQNIRFDNATSTISCDEVTTFDNSKIYEEVTTNKIKSDYTSMARELAAERGNKYAYSGMSKNEVVAPINDFAYNENDFDNAPF